MTEYVKIAILNDEVQANLLKAMLEERQIPFRLHSYHDFAYDGIFQNQKGWGHVEAPKKYRQLILDLLQDMNRRENGSR
ncbi:MAG TPA: hypothetical protein PKN04_15455 [bacterium]|jgi:hypothetical protein|nr:hypothetical protein [bacterium]HNT67180.1 hypothetical protein [bacterium]HOX86099.1 hypothetical protein [bacterium]HPG45687.1 hypothetical protein [bacterium]HPM97534.1 hypothetical protein [bacterium]